VRSGVEVSEDDARSPLAVQVLSGAVTVDRDGEAPQVGSGQLAWFGGGGAWAIRAVDDSLLLAERQPAGRRGGRPRLARSGTTEKRDDSPTPACRA
jgi:hypothetical protein